jgi:hypothetical protein
MNRMHCVDEMRVLLSNGNDEHEVTLDTIVADRRNGHRVADYLCLWDMGRCINRCSVRER